jgi:O-methyltransferase
MYTPRELAKKLLPRQAQFLYRSVRDGRDLLSLLEFVFYRRFQLSVADRISLVDECYAQIADKNSAGAALRYLCLGNSPIPAEQRLALVRGLINTSNYRRDAGAILAFLDDDTFPIDRRARAELMGQYTAITQNVACHHTEWEIFQYVREILATPKVVRGDFVEAGCFKGGSTAKFSLAANIAGRKLLVFDSFEGIPEHSEPHEKNIFGNPAFFRKGSYKGEFDEVKDNVTKYGSVESCEFVKGWFDDTLPTLKGPIAGVYLDVDLAASTRTCLKYFYPLLQEGGVLFSQDGHLPLVIGVFSDDRFWEEEVGYPKPRAEGLGTRKLIRIVKPRAGISQAQRTP